MSATLAIVSNYILPSDQVPLDSVKRTSVAVAREKSPAKLPSYIFHRENLSLNYIKAISVHSFNLYCFLGSSRVATGGSNPQEDRVHL